ncbi:transposable element Tc3 transposase [Trichonephila clavipes]|nr:transposable element Tc3 transposase [Trichonephila clavipes]
MSARVLYEEHFSGEDKLISRNRGGGERSPLHAGCVQSAITHVLLDSDEAHFWLNGYVNKQNCRIWSEANPHVYVETPLHPEKLTVWCALWAGGILLQKR